MGTLSELLRWKKEVVLKDENGKEVKKVYVRVIGDYDLQEAYRNSRLASARKRAALRDSKSPDYLDEVATFIEASAEECKQLLRTTRANEWVSQAYSTVVRPDEVTIGDIAVDPDAPTLEEQEKVDAENAKIDQKYQEDIQEYIAQKGRELEAELEKMEIEELRLLAQVEVTIFLPLSVFLNELQDEKVWRAVYEDKEYKIRGFNSLEDYRQMLPFLRQQLVEEYNSLETNLETVKN